MALALLIILSAITLASAYLFTHPWLPFAASSTATAIDGSMLRNIAVVGIAFITSHLILAGLLWKYRGSRPISRDVKPNYERRIEFTAIAVAVILFMGMNISGQNMWAKTSPLSPRDTSGVVRVEVVAEQFRWYFRYPGADGVFGKRRVELQDASLGNPLGLDKSDAAAADDVIATTLTLPADADVRLTLRTHDVIHSFFVPALRLKQDSLPGRPISLGLRVEQPGEYEIVCAELCGLGHHTMNSKLKVVPRAAFDQWSQAAK